MSWLENESCVAELETSIACFTKARVRSDVLDFSEWENDAEFAKQWGRLYRGLKKWFTSGAWRTRRPARERCA
jgi:hypothetical protein